MTQAREPRNADTNALNNFSGGLNTTASAGFYPAGDSPIVQNVEITDKGTARTRKGTWLNAVVTDNNCRGAIIVPYQTRSGNVLIINKQSSDIVIFSTREFLNQEITFNESIRKTNVWDDRGASVKPDYVITSESVPRIIFTTGVNPPVQLTFVESNVVVNTATVSSFVVKSSYYKEATVASCVAFCNGIEMSIDTLSYANGELTVNLTELYDTVNKEQNPFGYDEIVCELVFVTWQWMCQGDLVKGENLYETATRFNSNEADKTLAIPPSLLKNLDGMANRDVYPILVYSDNSLDVGNSPNYFTYVKNQKPTTSNEFVFSGGIFYNSASLTEIGPNFSHVTFGALEAGGEPSEVHFVRAFKVTHYERGNQIDSNFLTVRKNGFVVEKYDITKPSFTEPIANSANVFIRRDKSDDSLETFNSDDSLAATLDLEYISFDAETGFSLAGSDVIEFIYSKPVFIGSAAQNAVVNAFLLTGDLESVNLIDGYAVPLYGIQEYADYVAGSFPRCVSFYQGRVIYGGFILDPTKIIASDVKGVSETGLDFQNVSVAWGELQNFEPVVASIAASGNEALITHITESSGSCIVFTKSHCFRVYGGQTAFSPTSVVISRISSLGCVNPQSAVTVDNAVYFLSESGLYRLSPSIEIGDFAVTLYSAKIQDKLKSVHNPRYAYLTYNKKRSQLYLGVCSEFSTDIADTLFVMNIDLRAFFEYRHFTNTWLCSSACSENFLRESYVFFLCRVPNNSSQYIISHPYFYHTDFSTAGTLVEETTTTTEEIIIDDPSGGTSVNTITTEVTTIVAAGLTAPISREVGTYDNYMIRLDNFRLSNISNVKDGFLSLNGIAQSFGDDWFKHNQEIIFVNSQDQESGNYVYNSIDYREEYPLVVFINDTLITSDNYSLSVSSENNNLYDIDFPDGFFSNVDRSRAGYCIPYLLSTPYYIRGEVGNRKFADRISLLLDNREFQDIYTSLIDPTVGDVYKNVLGSWKIPVNLNILRYMSNDELFGQATLDLSGSSVMTWDDLKHDYQPTQQQFHEFTKVTASPKGSADIIQIFIQTFSWFGFEIVAFDTDLSSNRRG